jgi:Holliday junction resolvase RusA-like endonuclease
MSYRLNFEIMGLPKMANGGHFSWQRDYRVKKQWQKLVGQAIRFQTPSKPMARVRATFTRFSSMTPDFDGLVHGFKPIVDALKHFGVIIDDKISNLDAAYKWEKASPGKGMIRVELEEIAEENT